MSQPPVVAQQPDQQRSLVEEPKDPSPRTKYALFLVVAGSILLAVSILQSSSGWYFTAQSLDNGSITTPFVLPFPSSSSPRDTDLECADGVKQWSYIWFQHIRKSGGSSLCKLLKENGVGRIRSNCQVFEYLDPRQLNASWNELKQRADSKSTKTVGIEWESFRLPFYLNHLSEFDDVLFLTVIRDPISRAWSDLNYNGTWHCNTGDLWECAHSDYFWFSDFCVRMFSGLMPNGYRGENHFALKRVEGIHLEIALSVLRRFDVVIILKEWNQHRAQLERYGITNTRLTLKNENKHRELSDALRAFLTEINRFDLLFYEEAKLIARQKTLCALTRK